MSGGYSRCPDCGDGGAHPRRHVLAPGVETCIDLLIWPLIDFLWNAGCSTKFSCQGADVPDPNCWPQVTFASGAEFDKALPVVWDLAVRAESVDLLRRISDLNWPLRGVPGHWTARSFLHTPGRLTTQVRVLHRLQIPYRDLLVLNLMVRRSLREADLPSNLDLSGDGQSPIRQQELARALRSEAFTAEALRSAQ